jgi:hypothetical protein
MANLRCPACGVKPDGVARQRGVCRVCGKALVLVTAVVAPARRDRRIRHSGEEFRQRLAHGDGEPT